MASILAWRLCAVSPSFRRKPSAWRLIPQRGLTKKRNPVAKGLRGANGAGAGNQQKRAGNAGFNENDGRLHVWQAVCDLLFPTEREGATNMAKPMNLEWRKDQVPQELIDLKAHL